MAKRSGEFPLNVMNEVKRRGVCSECGGGYDPDDPWHVHHKIWLEYGLTHSIPHAVLISLANADLIHRSCHYSLHNQLDEPPQKEIDAVLKEYNKKMHQVRMWMDEQLERPRRII